MSDVHESNGMSIVVAAVIGAAVGAGVALLWAPCSGRETREWLAHRTRELKDRAKSGLEHGKEAIRSAAKEIGRDSEDVASAHDRPPYTEANATTARG